MTATYVVDPLRVFEVKGEVCQLLSAPITAAVAANQQIVAAITGKRIRIMGWLAQNQSAAVPSDYTLINGSGGPAIIAPTRIPINTIPADLIPITVSGYGETSTSTGLFITVAGAGLQMTVFYIAYTP